MRLVVQFFPERKIRFQTVDQPCYFIGWRKTILGAVWVEVVFIRCRTISSALESNSISSSVTSRSARCEYGNPLVLLVALSRRERRDGLQHGRRGSVCGLCTVCGDEPFGVHLSVPKGWPDRTPNVLIDTAIFEPVSSLRKKSCGDDCCFPLAALPNEPFGFRTFLF